MQRDQWAITDEQGGSFRRIMFIVFLSAYILRLLTYLLVKGTPVFDSVAGEALHYDYLAWQTVSTGRWLGGSTAPASPPLILYYLTLVYGTLGRNFHALRLLGAGFGSLLCVLIGLTGREFGDRKAGIIAAIITALFGPFVFFELSMPGTSLILCGLTAAVLLCLRALRRNSLPTMFLSGLCLGLALLGRPNLGLLWLVLGAYVISSAHRWRRRMALAALLTAGLLAAVLPPVALNYRRFGEPILTPAYGIAFYLGNNSQANGRVNLDFVGNTLAELDLRDFRDVASQRLGRRLTWTGMSNYWLQQGLREAVSSPGRSLMLLIKKIGQVWEPHEFPIDASYGFYKSMGFLRIPFLTLAQVALLALPGLACLRRRREDLFLAALILAGTMSIAVLVTSSRYRLPIAVFAIILAGLAAERLRAVWQAGSWRRIAVCALGALSLIAALSANPYAAPRWLSRDYMLLSNMYYQKGRYDEALIILAKADSICPNDAEICLAVADVYKKAGYLDAAIVNYRRAVELCGEGHPARAIPSYHDYLGDAYLAKGMTEPALAQYLAALRQNPYYLPPYTKLARIYQMQGRDDLAKHTMAALAEHR